MNSVLLFGQDGFGEYLMLLPMRMYIIDSSPNLWDTNIKEDYRSYTFGKHPVLLLL